MNSDCDTVALRALVSRVVGGGTPARSISANWTGDIPWASVKDLVEGKNTLTETSEHISPRALRESASNLIPAGTPIVCTRMAVGRAAIPSIDVAINQDLKALYPAPDVDARFLLHTIAQLRPQLDSVATGSTVKGLQVQELLRFRVPRAELPEQRRIAQVLDTLDVQISTISQIIGKLTALRNGLLHDLLTRGIAVSGDLRPDSSNDRSVYVRGACGLRPEEWRDGLLDQFANRGSGHTPNKNIPSYWNGGVPWVSLADSSKLDQFLISETDKEKGLSM